MCGIAGILWLDGRPVEMGLLRRMAEAIRHRGPDGEGYVIFGSTGLAHRRLAIIDVQGGRQPLQNEDGSVTVTFNGEIYNFRSLAQQLQGLGHVFRTDSDTEVLVHAYEQWGESCVDHLRGMFAFAIWDERHKRLFLARDRLGIKPLFYLQTPNCFAFASEIQSLRTLPEFQGSLDLLALDLYLHFQYIPAPFTIFRQIRKLPPAHTLSVCGPEGARQPRRYWQVSLRARAGLSEAEWLERFDAALRETVSAHLVSDVPFGAFLSGGVDSSVVVAHMSRVLEQPVRTYSIGFQNPAFDESRYARQVAEKLGTLHHEEFVEPDAMGILPRLVRHYGEPFADSSAVPTYYVSRMASQHVKMVLSGDGGDESFAGYSAYASIAWHHRRPEHWYGCARFLAGTVLRAAGLRPALPKPDDTWYESAASCYFGQSRRRELWRPEHQWLMNETRQWFDSQMISAPSADLCSRYQHYDLQHSLPHDMLTKVDVASMAHGLEVRVPLLDHVLVELAAEMPADLKLRRNGATDCSDGRGAYVGKYILKRHGEQFFPGPWLHRRKQGFGVPVGDWFRGTKRDDIRDRLQDEGNQLNELFSHASINRLLSEHESGVDHSQRLWTLLFLAEWSEQQSSGMPETVRSRGAL